MLYEDMQDLWDMFHPADGEEFSEDGDYEELEAVPLVPTIDRLPDVVDYSTRGPNDFVLGGPLGAGRGNGRHFENLAEAYAWAVKKYGKTRVALIPQESEFRWGLLIKSA